MNATKNLTGEISAQPRKEEAPISDQADDWIDPDSLNNVVFLVRRTTTGIVRLKHNKILCNSAKTFFPSVYHGFVC